MQLLGLFTASLPIYREKTLDHGLLWPRVWTWVVAALGLFYAIASLPSYYYAAPIWSAVASFFASAAQSFMVLQLALFADVVWSSPIKED